jgi:Tol biopolymer transport system component
MLQEGMDRKIPEGQWTALQSHLEGCAECRQHSARLRELERDLRRELRSHWDAFPGPQAIYAGRVKDQLQKRVKARRRAWAGSAVLLALVCFWMLGGLDWLSALAAAQRTTQTTGSPPQATQGSQDASANRQASGFDSTVLITASPGGHSDLFLLNPGGLVENLTSQPGKPAGENSDPAWSPDGEWIGYLSTLSGKKEVYVTSAENRNPIQLTQEPGIDWVGPLSWSPDGRWIALTGVRRDQGGQSWIYLVPLNNGDGPRALAGTRGGMAPEFSPNGTQVAFLSREGGNGSVVVFTFGNGDEFPTVSSETHWIGPSAQGIRVTPGVIQFKNASLNESDSSSGKKNWQVFERGFGLDWSPDGSGLAYIGMNSQTGGAQLVIENQMDYLGSLEKDYNLVSSAAQSIWPEGFASVTWMPGGAVAFLEDHSDARADPTPGSNQGCLSLETRRTSLRKDDPTQVILGGLCVDAGLDQANWSADGRWLVLVARTVGETRRFLYAVYMPWAYSKDSLLPGTVVRISDATDLLGANTVVRVRPRQPSLNIKPQPAQSNPRVLSPSDISQAPGEVVFSLRNNAVTVIVSASPDGTRGRVLTSSPGNNRCPRFSPDGSQVVFITDDPAGRTSALGLNQLGQGSGDDIPPTAGQEIYLLSRYGGMPEQLSNSRWLPEVARRSGPGSSPFYDCPSWSPDGKYLASPVSTIQGDYLAIFPLPAQRSIGAREQFIRLNAPLRGYNWTADSRRLVLSESETAANKPRILVVDLPSLAGGALSTHLFSAPFGLGVINGFAATPDGEQVFLFSTQNDGAIPSLAFLRQFTLDGWVEGANLTIGRTDLTRRAAPGALTWLGESGLGIISHAGAEAKYKSYLQRFNTNRGGLETLAAFEDEIYNVAWTPDGSWAIFSAESGLWALDVNRARRGQAAPVWISPQAVDDLDWR